MDYDPTGMWGRGALMHCPAMTRLEHCVYTHAGEEDYSWISAGVEQGGVAAIDAVQLGRHEGSVM